MKLKYGRGNAMIELSGDLGRKIEDAVRRVAPSLLDRMEDTVEELRDNARARWPVGKDRAGRAHSRDTFEAGVRLADLSTVEGYVRNTAPYAYFIKSMQNNLKGKSAWQELARKPLKGAAQRLAQETADDLQALLGGAR